MEYTKGLPTGSLFREWAAIGTISGALTRRVWIRTSFQMPPLFPNLFILLTGDPGTGKDIAMGVSERLWFQSALGDATEYQLNLGSLSLSAKGLVDAFVADKARQVLELPGKPNTYFHSVLLCAGELGTLMPEYNAALASMFCETYNCGPRIDDQIRNGTGQPIEAENPHIAMILGTQPAFLASAFPEEAYGMGFFSRLNLAFEPNLHRKPLYLITPDEILKKLETEAKNMWSKLVSDLRIILRLAGEFTVPLPVRHLINDFHMTECDETAPTHPRFKDYNIRRSLHAQKLAMCFSVARSSSLIIEEEDWHRALDLLLRTESRLPAIFADVSTSHGFHNSVEEVVHSAKTEGSTISERQIVKQLRKRHKVYEIKPIIQSMIDGGELKELKSSTSGRTFRLTKAGAKLKLVK